MTEYTIQNKKAYLFFMGILFAFFFCACSSEESRQYTVTRNGIDFTIDTENGTIFDGTYTYDYVFSGNSSEYSAMVTYPNGSSYQLDMYGNGAGTGKGSDDYDKEKYADGYLLCKILGEKAPKKPIAKNVGLLLVVLVFGIFGAAFPRVAWKLEIGWMTKNGEPSDVALGLYRWGGVVLIVVAVALFI